MRMGKEKGKGKGRKTKQQTATEPPQFKWNEGALPQPPLPEGLRQRYAAAVRRRLEMDAQNAEYEEAKAQVS